MENNSDVVGEILLTNPWMDQADLVIRDEYIMWTCEHGLEHMVYSATGDLFVPADECGLQVITVDPLPGSGMEQCEQCGEWVEREIVYEGLCPMCSD